MVVLAAVEMMGRGDDLLRVIIGAGDQRYDGWIPTDQEQLDLADAASFQAFFRSRRADGLLCEHVWEHLDLDEAKQAAINCFGVLKPGARLRIAVPDRRFPNEEYQRNVQVGGPGPADHPAFDHKVVYDLDLLRSVLTPAGFEVIPLEWWDEDGNFQVRSWDPHLGVIYRSSRFDHRNADYRDQTGPPGFTSLIVDAVRPENARLVTETLDYDNGRAVTAVVPGRAVESVVYVADGGWHTERLAQALDDAGHRSTLIVGVHGLDRDDDRLAEYVPGFDDQRFRDHEQFFVHQARAWTGTRLGVSLPCERTGVWGASLGAEFALAVGLGHPDIYGAVLAASPGAGFRPPDVWPDPLPRFSLVAGVDEPFFLDNAQRWAAALEATRATAALAERPGGHGDQFWYDEFPAMVSWAFPRP